MGAGRSFGFEVGGQVQRPAEAEIIREVAKKLLEGVSAATIATELNARGITTSRVGKDGTGGRWTPANLTRMIARPRNGGLVLHRGEILGPIRSPVLDGTGRVVGTTEVDPILDRDTYEAVQTLVASRRRGRRPTGKFLLTGLLTCSTCQRPMNGATRPNGGPRAYRCPPQLGGCGRSIDADHTEAEVDRYMVKLLSDPRKRAKIAQHEAAITDARAKQLAEVEAIEEQLADLEVKRAMGEIIQRAYDRAKPVLDRRLKAARDKLDGIGVRTSTAPLDAAADWADATSAEKRALIQRFGVEIAIGPFEPGKRRFNPERVQIS